MTRASYLFRISAHVAFPYLSSDDLSITDNVNNDAAEPTNAGPALAHFSTSFPSRKIIALQATLTFTACPALRRIR
jgi:hypothetical protein